MLNLLETTDKRPDSEKLAAWQNRINGWREKDCLHYENSDTVIKLSTFFRSCRKSAVTI